MKDKVPIAIERYRIKEGLLGSDPSYGMNGAFYIPHNNEENVLQVLISNEMGWDHASVSLLTRTPTWDEMCYIKRIFFKPEETVIQFHPAKGEYINFHPHCLHLWKKQGQEYELPPSIMIAPT